MSLEFYKILHLICIILIPTFFSISLFSESPRKWISISGMALSILLLISGFAMMAKLGYTGFSSWPLWIKLKLIIWTSIAGLGPLFKKIRGIGLTILITLFNLAIILVVIKPH